MSVIAVTGRKGGVGKSTISAHLAGEFVAMGKRVAVLDADPQLSLVAWAGLGDGLLIEIVKPLDVENVRQYRKAVSDALKGRDIVIIDTPPGFADPALQAALVADMLILPVGPSPLDILPARDAVTVASEARAQRKDGKPLVGLVPSKTINSKISKELPDTLAEMGELVLPSIGQRAAIANATLDGMTVQEHSPSSKAAQEFKALALAVWSALNGD